jgi:fatty-acyl-CoA synthase
MDQLHRRRECRARLPKVAKWQLPDDVVFVDALPMTATGKVSKKDLRARFANHRLPE